MAAQMIEDRGHRQDAAAIRKPRFGDRGLGRVPLILIALLSPQGFNQLKQIKTNKNKSLQKAEWCTDNKGEVSKDTHFSLLLVTVRNTTTESNVGGKGLPHLVVMAGTSQRRDLKQKPGRNPAYLISPRLKSRYQSYTALAPLPICPGMVTTLSRKVSSQGHSPQTCPRADLIEVNLQWRLLFLMCVKVTTKISITVQQQ